MSDLNTASSLKSTDSFVIKDSDYPGFKYLPVPAFQSEVLTAMKTQQGIARATASPVTVAPFSTLETNVFLDFVSASATLEIRLPAAEFEGQKVYVSINVLSGTALTTIVVKDDALVTLFTYAAVLTTGFVVDQDLVWKRL